MSDSLLRKAQDGLKLLDIQMHKFGGWVAKGYEPRASDDEAVAFQTKRTVSGSSLLEITSSEGEASYIYRVDVEFGIRYIEPADDAEDKEPDPTILALIEAGYHIDYALKDTELKDNTEALDVFATINAPHHAWSFWREYVDSQTSRMRLPKYILPMLPRINND